MMTSTDEEVAQAIQVACGSPIQHKARLTEGNSNEVYEVSTMDGQEVIVRIHWYTSPYFENEKWALEQLRRENLSVPHILYVEHNLPGSIPRSLSIQSRLKGRSLQSLVNERTISEEDLRSLLFEAGKLLRRIHVLPTKGFGRIDFRGNGQEESWEQAYIKNLPTERVYTAATNVGLSNVVVREAIRLLIEYAELGKDVTPCLLHGDFGIQNILVDNGAITGLIDFEFCESGDPAKEAPMNNKDWDVFFGREPVPSEWLWDGYIQSGPLDESFGKRMLWFSLLNSLGGLSWHGINDKDNPRFVKFLKEQFPKDLDRVQQLL